MSFRCLAVACLTLVTHGVETCGDGQCESTVLVQQGGRASLISIPTNSVRAATLPADPGINASKITMVETQVESGPERVASIERGQNVTAVFTSELQAKMQNRPWSSSAPVTHDFREKEELDEHLITKFIFVPVGCALMVALVLAGLLEKHHISWVPESAVVICIGMLLGVFMESYLGEHDLFAEDDVFHETCAILLNLFFLPMIIFESGWSLKSRDFASQLPYIILFAVVGSLISFVIVGFGIMHTGRLGLHSVVMARTAFTYASLIAATDPVATLATYSKLQVEPLLNILAFGDSTLNDAVAIVLFKTLNDDAIMADLDRSDVGSLALKMTGKMFTLFTGSFLVGFGFAAFFLLILRFADMKDAPHLEILSLLICAYVSFCLGEVCGMSGIISCFVCAIFLGIYARPHLSYHGSLLGSFLMKRLATLMDICVFLLTGVCVVDLHHKGFIFAMWAIVACLIGRFVAVFSIGHVVNALKRCHGKAMEHDEKDWHLLHNGHLFMLWHAGLRGAIALTLSMQMGPWVDQIDGAGTRKNLQTATFVIVCFFLICFGGSTQYMLHKCEIPVGVTGNAGVLYMTEVGDRMRNTISWVDDRLAPILLGDKVTREANCDEDLKDVDVIEVLDKIEEHGGQIDTRAAARLTIRAPSDS